MVCLDTSFIIDLFHGEMTVVHLKQELDNGRTRFCVATPTIMELWSGACLSQKQKREKEKIFAFLQSLDVLDLTQEAAIEAGEIEAQLFKIGRPIDPEDCMIAAIARSHNETLVTGDKHFTYIEGLKILKY